MFFLAFLVMMQFIQIYVKVSISQANKNILSLFYEMEIICLILIVSLMFLVVMNIYIFFFFS